MKVLKAIFLYWRAGRWLKMAERLENHVPLDSMRYIRALDRAKALMEEGDRLWPEREKP